MPLLFLLKICYSYFMRLESLNVFAASFPGGDLNASAPI
jgi:hypothetical protein